MAATRQQENYIKCMRLVSLEQPVSLGAFTKGLIPAYTLYYFPEKEIAFRIYEKGNINILHDIKELPSASNPPKIAYKKKMVDTPPEEVLFPETSFNAILAEETHAKERLAQAQPKLHSIDHEIHQLKQQLAQLTSQKLGIESNAASSILNIPGFNIAEIKPITPTTEKSSKLGKKSRK